MDYQNTITTKVTIPPDGLGLVVHIDAFQKFGGDNLTEEQLKAFSQHDQTLYWVAHAIRGAILTALTKVSEAGNPAPSLHAVEPVGGIQ